MAIIQARLGSSRLPNKVLLKLPNNESIISNIIEGIRKVKYIANNIVVATSISSVNDCLQEKIEELSVQCYRGDEEDVLSRFYYIVKKENPDYVLRFTGDNPIIDVNLLEEFIQNFLDNGLDYSYSSNLPIGCNFEMMKADQIIEAFKNASDKYDKEHVTPYIKEHAKSRVYYEFKDVDSIADLRLTIDYVTDYAFIYLLLSLIGKDFVSLKDIEFFIKENQWILEINKENFQKRKFSNIKEEIDEVLPILKENEFYRLQEYLSKLKYNK